MAGTETSRPPTALGSQQSTAAASSLALVGAIITTAANFVIAILVSRSSLALAGVFWTATAVITILGNSSSLGTMTGLVFFMPQATRQDHPNPRSLILMALAPVVALSALIAAGVFVLAVPFADLVAEESSADLSAMLRTLAVVIPAWAITQTLLGATRGLGTMSPTVGVGQILRPGGQIVLLGLLFWRTDPTAGQIALAWGLPVLVGLGVAIVSVGRLGGWQRHGAAAVSRSEYWAYTRFRALSTTMQIALERIDVIVVSALLGAPAAGVYGSLSRYISAGNFLIFTVGQAMSAHLRRAISNQDLARAAQLLQRTTAWVVLIAWPYFLLVATKADPLARLINDGYGADSNILPILALGMMMSAFAGPIDLMLLMLGHSRASLIGVTAAIITDLVLLAILAPAFGLIGAAIAWSAGVGVQNLIASLLVRRTAGVLAVAQPSLLASLGATIAVVPIGLLTPPTLAGAMITAGVAGAILMGWIVAANHRLGLEELIPARILSRLPGF